MWIVEHVMLQPMLRSVAIQAYFSSQSGFSKTIFSVRTVYWRKRTSEFEIFSKINSNQPYSYLAISFNESAFVQMFITGLQNDARFSLNCVLEEVSAVFLQHHPPSQVVVLFLQNSPLIHKKGFRMLNGKQ